MRRIRGADTFQLRSGRTFYAHGGVLGMDDEAAGISQGWDGGVDIDGGDTDDWGPDSPKFTPEERREIAEYMVWRWRKWARKKP